MSNPLHKDNAQLSSQRVTRNNLDADTSQARSSRGNLIMRPAVRESCLNINSQVNARMWLIKEELIVESESITTVSLSQAFLWATAGKKNTVNQLVGVM